jgi:glycine cleavage system aminomethyltransferase T
MSKDFSIHSDLQGRALAQRCEILAISGPTARTIMLALKERRYADLERFGLATVTDAIAQPIVTRYAPLILR